MILYYLDMFSEVNGNVLSYIRSMRGLHEILRTIDTSVIRVHWGALVAINGKLVGELWVETRNGLLRALVSDHDKASLLRLWDNMGRSLRKDYEHFVGISLRVQKPGIASRIMELVEHESRVLGEEVELLSRIQASELPRVRRFIHLQPWEGLLILRLDDEVSIYKASRVALKQAIPEIEKKYKLEVKILDKSFLE